MRVPVSSPWPDGYQPGSRPGSHSGSGLCWATVPETPTGAHLPGRNRRPDREGLAPRNDVDHARLRPPCRRLVHEPCIPQSLVRSQTAGQLTSAPRPFGPTARRTARAQPAPGRSPIERVPSRDRIRRPRARRSGSFFTRPDKRAHGPVSTQKAPSSHRKQTGCTVGPPVAPRAVSGCCRKVSTSKFDLSHRQSCGATRPCPPTSDLGPEPYGGRAGRVTARRSDAHSPSARGSSRSAAQARCPGASRGRSSGIRRGGRGGRCRRARARSNERKVRCTVLSPAGRG